jgi:hypothetical protein
MTEIAAAAIARWTPVLALTSSDGKDEREKQ